MPGSAGAAPALEPPIPPTQAFGLRAQPGQRSYGKAPCLAASSVGTNPPPTSGRGSALRKCLLLPGAK